MGVIFALVMLILLSNLGTISAQECRIIRILGGGTEHPIMMMLEPDAYFLSEGDCVVWYNQFTTEVVKVTFEEGKKCLNVTNAPTGFSLNAKSYYVTSWMPFGGTSSLRFMEKGTYRDCSEKKLETPFF